MATDQDPNAYGAHFQSLRSRALISPRAARRGGLDQQFTFGPGPRSAGDAGWISGSAKRGGLDVPNNDMRLSDSPSEYGQDYQALAKAHQADDRTEQAFQRFNSRPGGYGSTSDNRRELGRDEGDRRNHGSVSHSHIDDRAQQSKSGMYGRVSSGGSAGQEQNPIPAHEINASRNARQFPAKMSDGSHWLNAYSRKARSGVESYAQDRNTLMGDPAWRQD